MDILIGLIFFLAGGVWYQTKKRQSAEALLQNQKTKEEIQTLQVAIDKNNANLSVEEQKREELNAQKNDGPIIDSDILNYFNKPKS